MSIKDNLVVNGWTSFFHPLFLDELDYLVLKTEEIRRKDSYNFAKKNSSKRLAAISKLAFEVIPQDPSLPEYRQANTLGTEHKHWFSAKFFQQYRLFFRFDSASKIIVYAWVNDEKINAPTAANRTPTELLRKCYKTAIPLMIGVSCLMKHKVV